MPTTTTTATTTTTTTKKSNSGPRFVECVFVFHLRVSVGRLSVYLGLDIFFYFYFVFFVALRVFGRTEITPGLAGGGGRE